MGEEASPLWQHPPSLLGPASPLCSHFPRQVSPDLLGGKLAKADRNRGVGIAGRGQVWEIKSRLCPYILPSYGMIASYPPFHSPSLFAGCHKGLDSRGWRSKAKANL